MKAVDKLEKAQAAAKKSKHKENWTGGLCGGVVTDQPVLQYAK